MQSAYRGSLSPPRIGGSGLALHLAGLGVCWRDALIALFKVMAKEFIRIGGARQHNLKNLSLSIPSTPRASANTSSPSPPTPASSWTKCRNRRWISSRDFPRPSPSNSAFQGPIRAPSSPPRPRFTITCACSLPMSASPIAPSAASPSAARPPATSWIKSWPCRPGRASCCWPPSLSSKRGNSAMSSSAWPARASCAPAWMARRWSWATTCGSNWMPNSATPSKQWWIVWSSTTRCGFV